MRALTQREKSLGLFFGLAIFVIINLLGLALLNRQKAALEARLSDLQSTKQMHEILLDQRQEWTRKNELLGQKMPEYSSMGDAQTDLVEKLTASAKNYSLEITPPALDDPVQSPTHSEVSATVRVTGPIRSVVGWLFQLQQPAKFFAVSNFSLRSDKEPPAVVAEVRVARWFRLDETVASILNPGQQQPKPPEQNASPPEKPEAEPQAEEETDAQAQAGEEPEQEPATDAPAQPDPGQNARNTPEPPQPPTLSTATAEAAAGVEQPETSEQDQADE